MFNLFTRSSMDNNNSEQQEKQSFINLDVKFNVNIKGEVLMKILAWLIGGSVAVGGASYGINNFLSPSNAKEINTTSPTELVEQSSKVGQTN